MELRTTVRRIAASGGQLALLTTLAMVATVALVGAPRVANRFTDQGLRDRISTLDYEVRDVRYVLPADQTPLRPGQINSVVPNMERAMAEDLRSVLGDRWHAAQVGPDGLAAYGEGLPVNGFAQPEIALRVQSGITDAATLVEGAWPQITPGPQKPAEAAVSVDVARGLNLRIGSTFQLARRDQPPGVGLEVAIVGIFAPTDPRAPIWDDHPESVRPFEPIGQDNVPWRGVVAVHPTAISTAMRIGMTAEYQWRFRVDPERLDASRLDALITGVAGARRQQVVPEATALTGLDTALSRFADEIAATRSIFAIVQAGVLATVFGLVLLAALAIVERRHSELVLLRARGATTVAIGARLLTESIVVIPVAVAAAWVAALQVPGRPGATDWLAVAVAVGAVLAVPVLAGTGRRRRLRLEGRDDVAVRRRSPRRITAEIGLVGLAALGAYLLRERGFSSQVGVDPYLVSVPVLLAAAAALIGLRTLPWVLRRLAGIAGRARGAVPFVGLAGAARTAPATLGPLAVMVVAISTGVFSAVVVAAVEDGRDRAAILAVPADAMVRGFVFPADTAERMAALPGVSAVAATSANPATRLLDGTGRDARVRGQALVLVVDGPAFARVLQASGVAAELPAAVLEPGGGAEAPAIVTPSVARQIGDRGAAIIQGQPYRFRVAGVSDTFPSLAPGTRHFMVLPAQALAQTAKPILPNGFLVAGDIDAPALMAVGDEAQTEWLESVRKGEALKPVLPTTVTTPADYRSRLERTGVNRVLSFTFTAGAISAISLVLLSVGFAVVAGARGRGRMLSRLRTMGLSRGQGRRLFLYELTPVVATGVVTGAVVGAALPSVTAPVLALSTFTDGVPVTARLDPRIVVAVAGLAVASLVAALFIESMASRRMRLGEVLRLGEENR